MITSDKHLGLQMPKKLASDCTLVTKRDFIWWFHGVAPKANDVVQSILSYAEMCVWAKIQVIGVRRWSQANCTVMKDRSQRQTSKWIWLAFQIDSGCGCFNYNFRFAMNLERKTFYWQISIVGQVQRLLVVMCDYCLKTLTKFNS